MTIVVRPVPKRGQPVILAASRGWIKEVCGQCVTVEFHNPNDPREHETDLLDLHPDPSCDGRWETTEARDIARRYGHAQDHRWLRPCDDQERIEGQRKRVVQEFITIRGLLDALEGMIEDATPTASTRQGVTSAAARLSNLSAVLDELHLKAQR